MCVDADSRPPISPIAGGAIASESVVLTAEDGNRFRALQAYADEGPTRTAVLILADVRGLHRFYEELALRFAEAGFDALAFDYFGRTAGHDRRADDWAYMPHVEAATWPGVQADIAAAAARLREPLPERRIVTLGFCFGGRLSFLCAALSTVSPVGVVGFYGNPVGPGRAGTPPPVELVGSFAAPVLGLFGGADPGIPAESVERFERALTDAGIEHELVSYPGAPHSFFDRKQADYADESADAWRRALEFVRGQDADAPA